MQKVNQEPRNKVRRTAGDNMLNGFFYICSGLFAIACLFPFLLVIISSFTEEATLVREGYKLIPTKWSMDAYMAVLSSATVPRAYGVTLFITVIGTLLSLVLTAMCAYAISGTMLKYRNIITFAFYFTMLFNGGLVSSYILISRYLQLRDNIWVYILPALINPWNMFLMRNFFSSLPTSFRESAHLDGANEFVILTRIVIPLSTPAIATIALFYALGYWNTWMESMLYMDNEKLYSLQYLIMKIIRNIESSRSIAKQASIPMPIPPAETIRYATAILTIGPIIFLYPFLQRYFVSGLRVGGIKG